eukprot:4241151-Prymnesium_polylepis.1
MPSHRPKLPSYPSRAKRHRPKLPSHVASEASASACVRVLKKVDCHVIAFAMRLPYDCHTIAVRLPCDCRVIAVRLLCDC